ncbi:Chitin elicitor-binding protein [Acorus gramineus]|uniref:Chitin elicitor-binding protein n=1 Tax=Acorus gramineus TaxID=55184 RepID=A0AAV9BB74_ACOGR|nr:Chitin elicitor-binding protein [Acorus gramineus]
MLRLFLLLAASLSYSSAVQFSCTSSPTATCQSMIGYTPANSTTLSSVQSLFGVRSLLSLLGANGLPLSASPNQSVPAGSPVRVPIPCACSNGTGASDREPVYVVKKGDGLDFIARTIFSGFVKYQEIAAANGIADPNKIQLGQKLRIPLPCSCDDVDGLPTVHYGHVVAAGSTVAQIASAFGTREDTLLRLNGMDGPKKLQAGQILDVPLRACASSIPKKSMDHNLLVPNGSYAITANDCVRCSCSSSSWQLACEPAQGLTGRNTSVWKRCPSTQCNGNLTLGTTNVKGCDSTTCAYEGYNNRMIITGTVANTSYCNGTPAGFRHGLGWGHVFVVLNLGLLSLGMF